MSSVTKFVYTSVVDKTFLYIIGTVLYYTIGTLQGKRYTLLGKSKMVYLENSDEQSSHHFGPSSSVDEQ
jgi:hypothetical protein